MKNKLFMLLILAALTVCAVPAWADAAVDDPAADTAELKEGWDGDQYYISGEKLVSVLQNIDGAYYYFGQDGKIVKDQSMKVGKSFYSFGSDGKAAVKTLKTIKGKKYYFGKDGAALTKAFKKVKDGKKKYTFYFGKDGAAYTAKKDDYAVTMKAFKIGKKQYGFDEDAHMVTGLWVVNGSKKDTVYSFNKKNGACNKTVSKKLTKLAKPGKMSKTMYKDVLRKFGKPKKIRKSDGCNAFAGGDEKDYKDFNFRYPHLEVSISEYTKTGVYKMNGVYTYDEK